MVWSLLAVAAVQANVSFAFSVAASLGACQDQRNEFNPVNVLCPGDFDPVTNKCVIPTGGDEE